jgi:hypothetical protein
MASASKMRQVSAAYLRKILAVGCEYEGTFCGPPMVVLGNAGEREFVVDREPRRRRVVKQTNREMVSVFLDGPKANELIYLQWKGTKVRFDEFLGAYVLSHAHGWQEEDFMSIVIPES